MLRRFLPMFVFVWLQAAPARALDPARHITQYAHTAWRIEDGAFISSPFTIVQTPDGYMWVGTAGGVLQFDGVHFVPWTPGHGQQLPNSDVHRLMTTRDGSVWIGALGSLSRWKGHTLTNYATGSSGVDALAEDNDGRVWIGKAYDPHGTGPLCQVRDTGLRCFGPSDGIPFFKAQSALADRDGALWIGGDTVLLRWAHGTPTVYPPPGSAGNEGMTGVVLAPSPDGGVWVGIPDAGLGLQRFVDGRWQPFETPTFHGSSLVVTSVHTDREGALWVGTYDRGIYRIYRANNGDVVDHFDRTNGLSDNSISDIAEDREGNLWVATYQGVDRFADKPVASVSVAEGLCSAEAESVVAARDGSIWTGGDGALTRLHDGAVTCFRRGRELPGLEVTSLFEDHAGRLWVGLDQGLWVYDGGRFQQVTRPDARPLGLVTGIAEDAEQHIWITVVGPPRILMRVEGRIVREDVLAPPMPRRVAPDPTGGLWLGLFSGDLAHVRDGQAVVHAFQHPEGAVLEQLLPEADGSVLAATTYGLIGWRSGKALTLTRKNGLPCEEVYAIAFDLHGNLWLYMNCALGELTSADLQAWKQNPDIAVTIRTFDALDGVRPNLAAFVAGARSPDGRLWFANNSFLQVIDPEHLERNTVPPPVYIEQVVADRTAYPIEGGVLRLPPLNRDLEIDYAGLSFVAPQKVRFRYRLDGRDDAWQEAGTRRQAFYNDLRPGQYRFRVIACNNDGVWNEAGASLSFFIVPAWYQTNAFVVSCVAAGILLILLLFRLRMRQAMNALSARFDERLAERTRIAREFHDTLLQTIEGSKLVADNALDQSSDPTPMRRAMEQLSEWLARSIQEGRAALHSLRTSTTETNDLAEGLRRAVEECRMFSAMKTSFTVQGETREMHPVVRDEIYRIAYEAIRNACVHSKASELTVALKYAQELSIRVSDNGAGIPAPLISRGKDGHYGLQGMQERAERIGAKLKVNSSANSGTVITVVIPGRVIFLRPTQSPIDKIASMFRATK